VPTRVTRKIPVGGEEHSTRIGPTLSLNLRMRLRRRLGSEVAASPYLNRGADLPASVLARDLAELKWTRML
jgi:hypothetical protein